MNKLNKKKKKTFLKSTILILLFANSINAFDFKSITSIFSKNTAKTSTIKQSVCINKPSVITHDKYLFNRLNSLFVSRPKTFITLSVLTALSITALLGLKFIHRKASNQSYLSYIISKSSEFIRKTINENNFVKACKNNDVEAAVKSIETIDLDRAKELVLKTGKCLNYETYWSSIKLTPKMTTLLISLGANVNEKLSSGYTPLHYACLNHEHSFNLAKLLIDHGAHINCTTNFGLSPLSGKTPLDFACCNYNHSFDLAKLLVDHGAYQYPLFYACEAEINKNTLKLLKLLIDTWAYTSIQKFYNDCPDKSLINAIFKSNLTMNTIKFLFENSGKFFSKYNDFSYKLLFCAFYDDKNCLEKVKILIENGAKIRDEDLWSDILWLARIKECAPKTHDREKIITLIKLADALDKNEKKLEFLDSLTDTSIAQSLRKRLFSKHDRAYRGILYSLNLLANEKGLDKYSDCEIITQEN